MRRPLPWLAEGPAEAASGIAKAGHGPSQGRRGRLANINVVAAAVVLAVGLALGGCRAEEQDRPLHLEQGKYLGPPDQPLSERQLKTLRQRAERGYE